MKHARKLASLLLALVMVFALAATAFAAPTEVTGKGKITFNIDSANSDTYNYNLYRVLDLQLYAEGETKFYVYSPNATWHDFFAGTSAPGAAYVQDNNNADNPLVAIDLDGAIKYLNIIETNKEAFANAAMKYALEKGVAADETKVVTADDADVNNLTLGYYLMVPMDTAAASDGYGTMASLDTTDTEINVNIKAKLPDITKDDDMVSADVGQTVSYTITGQVPNLANRADYKYAIHDEITSGLTYNRDSVTVKIGDTTINAGYTLTWAADGKSFTLDIPFATLKANTAGAAIIVSYTATVNDQAVVNTNDKNSAYLEYGHNSGTEEEPSYPTTPPVKEEVYSAKITITKYTGDSAQAGTKLAGAKFAMMNSEGKFYKYTAATKDDPAKVEWVELTDGPAANDTDTVTDTQIGVIKNGEVTIYTTDDRGVAEFKGIADGKYYLVEVEAPAGYNRLQKATEVEVAGTNVDEVEMENKAQAGQTIFDTANNASVDIQNKAGTELPSTGGMGTTIFYVLGSILAIGAAVLLVTKKRMNAVDR